MTTAGWIAISVLWILVLVLCVALLALARQIGVLHERLQPVGALSLPKGVKVGDTAPQVDVETVTGARLTIGGGQVRAADQLVVFVSPTCPVCKALLPSLRAIRRSEKSLVEVILASDGDQSEHVTFIQNNSLTDFPYVLSEALGLAFGAGRLPHAVLIDRTGIVRASGLVNSREHLDSLFEARDRGVGTLQDYLEKADAYI